VISVTPVPKLSKLLTNAPGQQLAFKLLLLRLFLQARQSVNEQVIVEQPDTTFTTPLSVPLPSLVAMSPDSFGDFTATNSVNLLDLTLTSNPWSILGVNNGSGWMGDSSTTCNPASNSCAVSFDDGSTLSVDTQIVPVPASMWLFGTGLMGLAGIARRRRS
jgi:hypothetical protein